MDTFKLQFSILETNAKFRMLKKSAQMVLIISLDKVIWNWMDHYPTEFAELQKNPNEELSKNCEVLFDILDGFADNKKSRAAIWPLQIVLLLFSRVRYNDILIIFNQYKNRQNSLETLQNS